MALGGEITVESELGKGSTFLVRLPCEPVAMRPHHPASGSSEESVTGLASCSLLLIEGNPLSQGLLRAVLQPKVRALEIVSTGEAALAALAAQSFDRIVADAEAVRMDGDETAASLQRLAAAKGQAVISLLCPSPSHDDIDRLTLAGVDQIIAKPISAAGLFAALETAAGSSKPDSTASRMASATAA